MPRKHIPTQTPTHEHTLLLKKKITCVHVYMCAWVGVQKQKARHQRLANRMHESERNNVEWYVYMYNMYIYIYVHFFICATC